MPFRFRVVLPVSSPALPLHRCASRSSGVRSCQYDIACRLALALPAETVTSSSASSTPTTTDEDSRPTRTTERTATRSATRAADHDGDGDGSRSSAQASHASISTTSSHSLAIPTPHTHPHLSHSFNFTGTHTFQPHPLPTDPAGDHQPPSSHGQSAVAIVFEVLAGALALVIVAALARCWYSYRRTPSRDRIGALLSRHQLEREMEEQQRDRMERISRAMEAYRWRPPPPPYQHAPAYETVVATDSADGSIDWGRPSFPLASHSRPPTP